MLYKISIWLSPYRVGEKYEPRDVKQDRENEKHRVSPPKDLTTALNRN